MTMRLRSDLVLVKLAPPKTQTDGGLHLAHVWTEAPSCLGKAVQLGSGVRDVVVGDVVCFSARDIEPIDGFPTPHVLIRERAIAGVVELGGPS